MSDKKADQPDVELGLEGFLRPKPSPAAKTEEKAPETPKEVEKAPPKADAKPEGDKKEVKFLASTEKKAEKAPAEATQPPKEAKPAEKAAEKEPKGVEPPPKPLADWEAADNPYRKRVEDLEKRYRDTASYATQVNKTNLDLQRQLEIINKKLDGTYDPERDAPKGPSPEEAARLSAIVGRAEASLHAAYKEFGREKVDGWLGRYAETFGRDPFVQQRILASEMPVYEAINAIKGYDFFSKYGDDPDKVLETIRKQLEEELAPRIREEEAKKLLEKANKREEEPKGLSKARASGGAVEGDKAPGAPRPLRDLFSR